MRTLAVIAFVGAALAVTGCEGAEKPPAAAAAKDAHAPDSQTGIAGLAAPAVERHLSSTWGLKFTPPSDTKSEVSIEQGAVTHKSGARLAAVISGKLPDKVRTVACQAFRGSAKSEEAAEGVTETATGYLRDCAAMPFKGADPDAAKKWISSVAGKASKDGGHQTTISGVRYNLAVLPKEGMWVLSMSATA